MIRKSFFLLLISILFFSCKKEDSNIEISNHFWNPIIKVEKGDNEATLYLIDPRPFTEYLVPPSDPDYFEILISENNKDFTFFKKLPITTEKVSIPNLINGKSYYITVSSHKKMQTAVFSNTVMTIPSKKYEPYVFLNNIDFSINRVLRSESASYITFQSNELSTNTLFYRQLSESKNRVVERNSGFASWSPNSDNFIYIKNIDIGIYRYNQEFKLYDTQTSKIATLIEIDYKNYSAYNPQYSPDGNEIIYLSSEGNSERQNFDIWTFDLTSREKSKLTNFDAENFIIREINWVNNPDAIYLSGYYSSKSNSYNIYKLDIKDNSVIPVIESNWNDVKPALSPDNNLITFSSDRTGNPELWIYDFNSKEYKQITGGVSYNFDNRYTNIQWLSNNEILLTLFENTVSKLITIKLK